MVTERERTLPPGAARLRELVAERGCTRAWLADRVGINRWRLGRLCDGQPMTVDEAVRLASLFEVPVEEFQSNPEAVAR